MGDLSRIFERLYQEVVGRENAPGTGLGLCICDKTVELHGRCIKVDSAVGQGSTFTVWLPAVE